MVVAAGDAGENVNLLRLAAVVYLPGAEGLQSRVVGAAHCVGFATI